jgi:predicted nucleic acid-binding protein
MKKLRIYLDTSVISFLFADDAPERRDITREFFESRLDSFDVAISDVVLVEIGRTRDLERRRLLSDAVAKYGLVPVALGEEEAVEVNDLAERYMREGVIPAAKRDDAMHVALCTVLEFDVLLSWNFEHLANLKKQIRINTLNQAQGYLKPLLLLTPLEVMGDEDQAE